MYRMYLITCIMQRPKTKINAIPLSIHEFCFQLKCHVTLQLIGVNDERTCYVHHCLVRSTYDRSFTLCTHGDTCTKSLEWFLVTRHRPQSIIQKYDEEKDFGQDGVTLNFRNFHDEGTEEAEDDEDVYDYSEGDNDHDDEEEDESLSSLHALV